MSSPNPTFSVRVDVTNPGQFFACCGLLELAHRLSPGAEGFFDFDKDGPLFKVDFPYRGGPSLKDLLKQLRSCDIVGLTEEERRERKELEKERKERKRERQE
ncbi:MAG TPA: hypothetical protein EYP04_12940, partial [Anaerolineae bacterium]|nr:hypothetical protein [Anaerolineae bacterium]